MLGNLEVMNFPFVFGGTSAFNEMVKSSPTGDGAPPRGLRHALSPYFPGTNSTQNYSADLITLGCRCRRPNRTAARTFRRMAPLAIEVGSTSISKPDPYRSRWAL